MSKKQYIILIALIVILILVGGVYGTYYFWQKSAGNINQIACPMMAKLCPDGSAVGPSGPNCEFAECPSVSASPNEKADLSSKASATEDWQTYRNEQYGYEFKYPIDTIVSSNEMGVDEKKAVWVSVNIYGKTSEFDVELTPRPTIEGRYFSPDNITEDVVEKWDIKKIAEKTREIIIADINPNITNRTIFEIEGVMVGDKLAYRFSVNIIWKTLPKERITYVFISDNRDKKLKISYPSDNLRSPEILSTFKFTK